MTQHPIRSALCAVALATAVLAPALVCAQAPTIGSAPTASSAPAKVGAHAARKPGTAPRSTLDLHTPPLSHVYPREQLQYILAVDESDTGDSQEVNVKGEKYLMPVPKSQFQAIPWALMHPTQAWRVFTPIEQP